MSEGEAFAQRLQLRIALQLLLLVDDNPTNLRVLSHQLAHWGICSKMAASGLEALRMLDHTRFDLAILDMQMPDMDGVQLAQAIRVHATSSGLPLILFSSDMMRLAAASAGLFRATLSKPLRQSQMFDAIASVLLAQSAQRPMATAASAVRLADSLPLRLLVADDNAVNRTLAALVIKRFGYVIDAAENGRQAVEMAEAARAAGAPYDIVFMDVHMPEMDGYVATRQLIAEHGAARPFVIAMTANAMQGDRDACLAAGMDDYLSKPLDFAAVEKALWHWGQRRASNGVAPAPIQGTDAAPHELLAFPQAREGHILDQSCLDEMADYDEDGSLIARMSELYLADVPPRIKAMHAAHASGDAQALAQAAHALKGAASNIGAERLSAICKVIETAGQTGQLSDATPALAHLEASAQDAQSALEAYLTRGRSAGQPQEVSRIGATAEKP